MPIRSGVGIGEAQVFDTSAIANKYARQVAIDQASLQKQALLNQKRNDDYLKELATTISSAKTLGNGLHPQDAEAIIGYQDKFKELYEKAATAKTDKERKILQAEVESGFQKANAYVNGAKMFRKNLDDVAKQMTDNQYDYTDEQKKEFQKVYNAPYNQALTDGTAGINVLTYKRTPDFSEITKSVSSLDKIAKDLSVDSPKRRFAIPVTGKNIQDSSQYMSEIDPKSLFDNSLLLVQGNNKLKSTLKSRYQTENPNATEIPDDNKLAGMIVNDWEKSRGGKEKAYIVGGNVFKNPKETKSAEDKAAEDLNNYKLVENKVFISEDVYAKDPITEKTVKVADGKPSIKFEKFVPSPVSTPFDLTQISNVFNINDKKRQRLDSSTGIKMTGLGYSNGILNAVVVDKDNVSYSINTRDVPAFIKNGNQYKNALKKLNGEGGAQQQRTTTSNTNQRKSKGGISYTVED